MDMDIKKINYVAYQHRTQHANLSLCLQTVCANVAYQRRTQHANPSFCLQIVCANVLINTELNTQIRALHEDLHQIFAFYARPPPISPVRKLRRAKIPSYPTRWEGFGRAQ